MQSENFRLEQLADRINKFNKHPTGYLNQMIRQFGESSEGEVLEMFVVTYVFKSFIRVAYFHEDKAFGNIVVPKKLNRIIKPGDTFLMNVHKVGRFWVPSFISQPYESVEWESDEQHENEPEQLH